MCELKNQNDQIATKVQSKIDDQKQAEIEKMRLEKDISLKEVLCF